jgi:hypothetical protein
MPGPNTGLRDVIGPVSLHGLLHHSSLVPCSCHQPVCLLLLLLLLLPQGGSPWGAGTLAGPDGSRQPSEVELEQAVFQVRPLICLCLCIWCMMTNSHHCWTSLTFSCVYCGSAAGSRLKTVSVVAPVINLQYTV